MWERKNLDIGFGNFQYEKTQEEIEAPEGDDFPYENEIMQWMGTALIKATK